MNDLCAKIARLIQEKGWNREEFARLSGLNRLTVRSLFQKDPRNLHNATVAACAHALGLTVRDLREIPLPRLLDRINAKGTLSHDQLFDRATQPELALWADRNPEKARELRPEEWDELLSLQGTGGPLTEDGVVHFVAAIERRRKLVAKVVEIAGTDYLDLLEQMVDLVYGKIEIYPDRR